MKHLLCFVCVLLALSCKNGPPPLSEGEYTHRFGLTTGQYATFQGRYEADQRASDVDKLDKDVADLTKIADDYRKLVPPPKWEGVQTVYLELLDGRINYIRTYAQAVRAKKPDLVEKADQADKQFLQSETTKLFAKLAEVAPTESPK